MKFLALIFILGHGGNPVATTIEFPDQYPDSIWATTTSQGVFAKVKNGFRWLCEDAFGPFAGVRAYAAVGNESGRWLVSTSIGLFLTTNDGCDSDLVRGPLRGHRPGPLTAHPERPDEVVVATRSGGRTNDVFFSDDGGDTWVGAGIEVDGVTRTMIRSAAAPDRLYLSHETALMRSDDGGQTFAPLPNPPESDPSNVRFLTTGPLDPNLVFAYDERFPISVIFRSEDAGESWTNVLEVEDVSLGLVLSADGTEGLLTSPITGWFRSVDGGRTWALADEVVPRVGCLTRAPDGALHGCANPIFMGPWVLGTSEDFGESWTASLTAFEDVESQWDCGPNTRAWHCCQGLCPGNLMGPECGTPVDPKKDPLCAAPNNEWDGGVEPDVGVDAAASEADIDPSVDSATDGAADVRTVADAGPDTNPLEPEPGDGGGCATHGPGDAPYWLFIALLGALGRRRNPL